MCLFVQSRLESVLVGVLVCGSRVVVRLVNSQTGERLELSVAVFTWKQGPLQQIIQSSGNSFNELAESDKSPRHIIYILYARSDRFAHREKSEWEKCNYPTNIVQDRFTV